MRLLVVLVAVQMLFAALAAAEESRVYVPYSGIVKGTKGAKALRLQIENGSAQDMSCLAALAHWYSETLGSARPGDTLQVELWHDPKTGVISLLNETRDRMPVEAIWCGQKGAHHATRTRVNLPHKAGRLPPDLARRCTEATEGRLICLAVDG